MKIKKQADAAELTLEKCVYEIKPLFYLTVCLSVLNRYEQFDLWVKYAALGILVFTLYIIVSRLNYRGFWS